MMRSLQQIAIEMGIPFHRVRYAVALAGLQPVQRVGIVRLWSDDQVAEIREAVRITSLTRHSKQRLAIKK